MRWMSLSLALEPRVFISRPFSCCDEAELAAGFRVFGGRDAEITAVVRQADFLLGDVKLLDVEYHLLFQTVGIRFVTRFLYVLADARADGLGAGLLERSDLLLKFSIYRRAAEGPR